jgi:hypothetical protein
MGQWKGKSPMNGFEGIWAARPLERLRAALRRAWRSAPYLDASVRAEPTAAPASAKTARDPAEDRALLKAALLTRLSPHLRKDVGADEG